MTDYEKEAEKLVALMTIEEKCSQLKYDSPAIDRLGIPAYNWWNEGLHGAARAGTATVFPQAMGLAAAFDRDMIKKVGDVVSTETRAKYNALSALGDRDIYKGLTLWSPNVNIFRDPRWGRGQETFGEDPYLTAELGCEFVRGVQGDGEVMKSAACAKHFAVHSGPEKLRHSFDAAVSDKDLNETYLPAFKALVEKADVAGVMGAYNRVCGEPACGSSMLSKKLRDDWGFKGYFVSDCWAIQDFHMHHKVTATAPQSAALALKNGCDLNCGSTYLHVLTALEEGLVTEEEITRSVIRLVVIRMKLGALGGIQSEYDKISFSAIDTDESRRFNEECAAKGTVLLKNDGILPLSAKKLKSIAVIGPNADSRAALIGNYHGTASEYITFLDGIRDYLRSEGEDCRVFYAEGCHLWRDKTEGLAQQYDRISEAVAAASEADVTVVCLGLDETIEGEEGDASNAYGSGDKENLYLPESQRRLLAALKAVGKPLVTVVAAGSAINADCDSNALLHVFYPGARGGKALAEILFGKRSPSGKLPVTFYRDASLLPDFCDYSMKNRTYRYNESNENVLYPFGYGLSYGDIFVTSAEYYSAENGAVNAKITAENKGNVSAEDVIELYAKIGSESAPRNAILCGFKRVSLSAGEKITVEIAIPAENLTVVSESGERFLDKNAEYEMLAGTSQPDKVSLALTGKPPIKCNITSLVRIK